MHQRSVTSELASSVATQMVVKWPMDFVIGTRTCAWTLYKIAVLNMIQQVFH